MDKKNSKESRENLPTPIEPREIAEQKGVKCAHCGCVFNGEKIFCPICGLRYSESAKLPSEIPVIQPRLEQPTRSSRVFALLSLILGVAGPLALGIGWLLAIIFGFTALNLIKARGGYTTDKKLALWGVTLGFMWPIAIGVFLFFLYYHTLTEKHIRENEAFIMNTLQNIAITQRYIKSGYFFDQDNDGESEYANLEELLQIDYLYLDPHSLSSQKHGYSIQIDLVKEKNFRVIAQPLIYGVSGRRSFYIDESGILRGGQLKQPETFKGWATLPKVRNDSVFEEFNDEIAADLLNLAKKIAAERDFSRAQKILAEIKKNYYMSPASSNVKLVMENITVYKKEDTARELYAQAAQLIERGLYRKALSILKDIEKNYPDVLIITEVKRDRIKVERTIAEELEEEAKYLFAEAEKLELQGKYDQALSKYKKIINELDSTSYFLRAQKLIPQIEKRWKEEKAEVLFANLSQLKPADQYTQILTTIGVLMDHYPDTNLVKNKKNYLVSLKSKALSYKEKDRAVREFQRENFQVAVQAGEEALRANPALAKDINPLLETSYIKLAETYFKNKEFAKAAANYQKWMRLSPQQNSNDYQNYIESLYQVAKSIYLSGNYQEAKKNLLSLKKHLAERDELWYLLGSILALEKNYEEALNYFGEALRLNNQNLKAWYKSGLCRLCLIQNLENKLPQELKQLNSLKRGMDIVIEVIGLVNDLHTKDIELRLQEKPKVLEHRRQLTPDQIKKKKLAPAQRAKFLANIRAKLLTIEKELQKNEMVRKNITSLLKEINRITSLGYRDLKKAAISNSNTIPDLAELASLVYKKKNYLAHASNQFEAGLQYEKHVEQKMISCLQSALVAFSKQQPVDRYIENIDAIHDSFWKTQMNKKISEGNESVKKALSIKIFAENYLAGVK